MGTIDPAQAIPIRKLGEYGYPGSRVTHYREIAAGRLIARKVRGRTFVLRVDADAWLRSLPKIASAADTPQAP
jgi:hypothetical protein